MRIRPLLALLLLAACDTQIFAPRVAPAIATDLETANRALGKIAACIELDSCDGRAGFPKVEDDYITAFAAVTAARLQAAKISTSTDTAQTAKELFVDEIKECEDAIRRLNDAHRRSPTLREIGLVEPILLTCDLPLTSARTLR